MIVPVKCLPCAVLGSCQVQLVLPFVLLERCVALSGLPFSLPVQATCPFIVWPVVEFWTVVETVNVLPAIAFPMASLLAVNFGLTVGGGGGAAAVVMRAPWLRSTGWPSPARPGRSSSPCNSPSAAPPSACPRAHRFSCPS